MNIVNITESNRDIVNAFFEEHWGSPEMVISTGTYNCSELSGFIASDNEKVAGLITYIIKGNDCELISLDSVIEEQGVGSKLLNTVERVALESGCKTISLITTNDNLHVLKFYQKRGYRIINILPNAVQEARKIKPSIPLIGNEGIPLHDELQLQKKMNLDV